MVGAGRDAILETLRAALEPLPFVLSLFEGGSTAFGRADEWSDIDLCADIEDGHEDDVFDAVEAALTELSPIEHRWIIPLPAWHGMAQRFYRLRDAPEHLVIDLSLRPRSRAGHFGEVERHGVPMVYFDKGAFAVPAALDLSSWQARVKERVEALWTRFHFTAGLAGKELARGRIPDAYAFYHSFNLVPLVEVLRIRYCPERHDFGLRYLTFDLPPEVAGKIAELCLVSDADDLVRKHETCSAWLEAELEGLHRSFASGA